MFDIEACLRAAEPGTVPPKLFKEFWDGQIARQRFEDIEANLWPTPEVRATFFDVFEKLDTGIRAFAGNIDAQTDLTDKQRSLLQELSSGLLVEIRRTLIEGDIDERIKPGRPKAEGLLEFEDDGL